MGAEYRSGGTEDRHVALAATPGSTPAWAPLRLRAPTRALRQSPDGVGGGGQGRRRGHSPTRRRHRRRSGEDVAPVVSFPARFRPERPSAARGVPLQPCSRSSGDVTRDRRRAARSARQRSAMLGAIEPVERARPGGSVHWSAEIRSDAGVRGDSARRVRTCADLLHRCL